MIPEKQKRKLPIETILRKRYGVDLSFKIPPPISISVGIPEVDQIIGCFPVGRLIELYGKEGSGKGCIAYSLTKAWLNANKSCVWLDAENVFDPSFAEGYDIVQGNNFSVVRPLTLEDEFGLIHDLACAKSGTLFVLDSLASLYPEIESDAKGKTSMGKHALVVGQNLKRMPGILAQSGSTLLVINQVRVGMGGKFAPKEKTSGGDSLKFFASMRLRCRKVSQSKPVVFKGKTTQPMVTEIRVVKNKTRGSENVSFRMDVIPGFGWRYAGGYKESELKGGGFGKETGDE